MQAGLRLSCSNEIRISLDMPIFKTFLQTLACWVILHAFCCLLIFLQNHLFRNTIGVSENVDPDQDRRSVGPGLGINCLQKSRVSADDSSRLNLREHY